MAKKRTDAERRARQCERLSRLLRTLHLIMGPGRWDAAALARELECSRRTVHRNLQTLSMAGVPWYYDDAHQAYRVRRGFKFPGVETARTEAESEVDQALPAAEPKTLEPELRKLIQDGEAFLDSLRRFLKTLKS